MKEIKDTKRATVHVGFDGRVHKRFSGSFARKRFENEVRTLNYLEQKGCEFVPRVIHADPDELYLVTTNCGVIVDRLNEDKRQKLFDELESFGVRHGDPFVRNVTYNAQLGRFCLIDFEFATIIETGEGLTIEDLEKLDKQS